MSEDYFYCDSCRKEHNKAVQDHYTCAACEKTYCRISNEDWNEEKILTEMKHNFGDIPEDQRTIVCDDCYKILIRGIN